MAIMKTSTQAVKGANLMVIKITLPKFLSRNDEDRFFYGLQDVQAFKGCKGEGRNLNIKLDGRKMTVNNIRELIALLYRYGVDLVPLAVISKGRYGGWLKSPGCYWYESMFPKIVINNY